MGAVYTMPSTLPFARVLAQGLLVRTKDDPKSLSQIRVLLPTRRACRVVQQAFLRESEGAALLLPKLQPLGEADPEEMVLTMPDPSLVQEFLDIPPAIPEMKRQIMMAGLIHEAQDISKPHALKLAKALCQLLDELYTEMLSLDDLTTLAPDAFSEHWQIILSFLKDFRDSWPKKLGEIGMIEKVDRHNRLLSAWTKAWQDNPPQTLIIAAGMTGSIPAAADFLKVIKGLPQGEIILPGLDPFMAPEDQVLIEESHPQYGLIRLLSGLETQAQHVQYWPDLNGLGYQQNTGIEFLLSETMRPASSTQRWQDLIQQDKIASKDLNKLSQIDVQTPQEEALCIALILREALEVPNQTAKLITADRFLARRVQEILKRWDIEIDDSAGAPIFNTTRGNFIMQVLEAVQDGFDPVSLLGLMKNQWFASPDEENIRAQIRRLDQDMRGIFTKDLLNELCEKNPLLARTVEQLQRLRHTHTLSLKDWVKLHIDVAQILATTPIKDGIQRLWSGEDGDALSAFFTDVMIYGVEEGAQAQTYHFNEYKEILESLGGDVVVRARYGAHARLSILGVMESRLSDADIVVLGGLNEGKWPPAPKADPWLSRQMREKIALPTSEQRIGFSAHDFTQQFGAKKIYMTRASKQDGTLTLPSRWLTRLKTVLKAMDKLDDLDGGEAYMSWGTQIDQWAGDIEPFSRPAPKPPIEARPTQISVTGVEAWMRDPYSVYAKYILNLRPLDALNMQADAALRGSIIHDTLHAYIKDHMREWPENAAQEMMDVAHDMAKARGFETPQSLDWWARLEALIAWFAVEELRWRAKGHEPLKLEHEGKVTIEEMTITAKADRIEKLEGGALGVIDYKTGKVQRPADAKRGYLPQLPLEALIAYDGGFEDIPSAAVGYIAFWQLIGDTKTVGEYKQIEPDKDSDFDSFIEDTRQGVANLIRAFAKADTPYLSLPLADKVPLYRNYDHLARVKEWADEDEGSVTS